MGKNKIITPVPPQPEILLAAEHFTYVNEMAARTGIPGSTVLRMLLDAVIHRLQFSAIEGILAPAALRIAYGVGRPPEAPPAPPAPEEPSAFSAQERLRRQQILAGLLPGPQCPGCKTAGTVIADPESMLLRCAETCGWSG